MKASAPINKNNFFFSESFQPGPNDVLIGRGKKCNGHIGNVAFRNIVASKLEEYLGARSKQEKSNILASVISNVRHHSPNGGFLKQDSETGMWFRVGDTLAREKTSQAFRDALHYNYRSSNSFKKTRRKRMLSKAKTKKKNTHKNRQESEIKFHDASSEFNDGFQNNSSVHPSDHDISHPCNSSNNFHEFMNSTELMGEFDLFDGIDMDFRGESGSGDLMSSCSSLCFSDHNEGDLEANLEGNYLEAQVRVGKVMFDTIYSVDSRFPNTNDCQSNSCFYSFASRPSRKSNAAVSA